MLLSVVGFFATPVNPAQAAPAPRTPPVTAPVLADPVRDEQWQLRELHARDAWRYSTGKGVTVAVIDSGVDASHPDLVGQVLPGIDLVHGSGTGRYVNGQTDPVGHGTTVAALIAGRGDDGRGAVGLAPRAKILPVRVLDEDNRYDDALTVANAVRWAVDNGARVVNLSLGGTGDSPALAAALDYAFARDVVVVACTGNVSTSSPTDIWYPAREPGVIAVAGIERNKDMLWSGSLTGPATVLTAPATGLLGAKPPGGFWRVQGTSFAAPLVSATAALVRSRWPDMSAGDVVNRLIRTARDVGPAGRDDRYGFGVVDPVAALTAAVPHTDRNPLDDGSTPALVGFGPAPRHGTSDAEPSGGPGQLTGSALGRDTNWAARPAGSPDDDPRPAFLGALLLLVLLLALTSTALVLRIPHTAYATAPRAARGAALRATRGVSLRAARGVSLRAARGVPYRRWFASLPRPRVLDRRNRR